MKTVYIRKDHAKALKEYVNQRLSNSILLTEESGNVRKKVKEIIKASFPPQMEQQLNMSLNDPYMISNVKPQVCQGGAEPQIWNSVANHPQQNTFLDFLRANLYSQLGINHKRGPIEYIIGATRIMCQDLGFYSFNESQLKGGLIIKFCKLLNAIHDYKKFFIEDGHDMDINLDGMSYTEFMAKFEKKYGQWREAMFQTMNSEEPTANGGYKVVPIKDKFVGTGCMPIGKSLEFLLSLGEYTDWCICHEGTLKSMYPQYTGGGGKVYVLLRGDYKEVEMKEGTDCPLDDYGLSMICVIVGPDGLPDNVTTRWNHNNGGENPEGLRTALDVQRVTGIKYADVFKPRTDRELDAMHMLGEDKVPSAMDQVDNKVNAGVMDAVTGGGMMEGAEPESDEYTIAGEGGNNENFHVNERKKSLMITEEQWKQLQLIIENEGTNLKKARNLLKKKGYNKEQLQEILNSIKNGETLIAIVDGKVMSFDTSKYCGKQTITEEKIGNFDFKKYFKPIAEFMKKDGLSVSPYPKVKLDWSEQDGLFIKTGYYEPESKTITIFCNDRHPKDILRTFCHEMIHHSQNLDCVDLSFSSNDDVKDNERLEEIESEAYLKGNVYFRKWTEYQNKSKDLLQEGKERKNDKGETVPEKCDKCGGDVVCQIHGEPVFVCKDCGKYFGTMPFTLKENTDPEDIDLSSFDIKTALNPKFWKDGHLDSRIRMKLLDIADDFIEFIGIDWVKPDDVIMTGSLANYNWNKKFSDIDLHIVLDYSKVDKRADFVKNYFYSQKELWNENHKDLKIFGFPVEVYVQDKNEKHSSTGVYSLDKDKWITEPERKKLKTAKINKTYIKKKVAEFVDIIDELEKNYKDADGDYALRKVSEKADKTFDRIKSERKSGLGKSDNEISNGNIIYKCLRRLGYIDKIFDIKDDAYNKLNSLSEGRTLLKEDQEGDSMKKARRYLVQNHGFTEEKANEVVRINVRQAFSALHHNEKAGKFIFGLTRILFDENISSGTKGRLNTILKVITSSDELYNSFDKNLNGLSASELIAKFSKQIEQAIQKQKNDMENSKEKYSNNYRIVRIDSFEDAKKYSDLTDFGDTYGHWCLTYREDMYRSYTNDGRNQIYFCLKDGLEDLDPIEGEGCPYDEFGLSMLSIIVSPAGGLLYCTTRWNHLHGGGDNMMNAQQIEELLGVDFNNTFLPAYDFERNAQKQIKDFYTTGNIGVFDFVDALNGFGDGHFCIVRAGEIYNIVHGNKVLFDGWFDDAYYNDGDFGIVVYRNDRANIVLPSGKFLFKTWFDRIYNNSEVFTVEKNGYANLISTDGKILSKTWFDWIGGFNGNRVTPVQLNDKYNLISIEGKLVSDTWFDSLSDFKDGYSVARLDGKENYIDTNGKLLFREWVDNCRSVYNGIGIIATQCEDILGNSFTGYYAIDLENRKMITDKPYELLYTTYDKNVLIVGYTKKDFPDYIERDKYNLLKNGKTLLLKEWVDNIKGFNKGGDSIFCKVVKDDKRNYVRMADGSYVFDKWYDDITITTWSFRNDFVFNIAVKNGENTLWNVADENGKMILSDWYNFVDPKIVNEQITIIVSTKTEEGGITNVVRDGKFILPFWVITIDHLYGRAITFTAERKFWAQVYTYFPENDTVVRGQYNAPNENCLYGAYSAAQFAEKFNLPTVQTY